MNLSLRSTKVERMDGSMASKLCAS
jgi:hypothetical protein